MTSLGTLRQIVDWQTTADVDLLTKPKPLDVLAGKFGGKTTAAKTEAT